MSELIERPKGSFNKIRFLDTYMEGHKGFIAGGCFKNIFKGTKIKDLDMFFNNESDFKEAHDYYASNQDYILSYSNAKVIAFKNKKTDVRVLVEASIRVFCFHDIFVLTVIFCS